MKTNNNATASQAVTVQPVKFLPVILKGIASIFFFLIIMGAAGTIEYKDDLYYSIPDAAFEEINLKLGDRATHQDIVNEYLADTEYYDSL